MGKSLSKKRWIKAAVLTVGVADCLGIYYASHRLDNTVPDEVRYDRTAYTVPESSNQFHAGNTAMFADAGDGGVTHGGPALAVASSPAAHPAKAAAAPKVVELAAAPAARAAVPSLRAPVLVGDAAPVARPAPAARLAAAAPVKAAPAKAAPLARPAPVIHLAAATPKPVQAKPARQLEGPHKASVAHMLAALQPVAKAAPKPAAPKAVAPVVTPHLATVAQPERVFHAAPARLTHAKHTAALALGTDLPTAKVTTIGKAKAKAHGRASLARLVPQPRESSEFATAFAGMDSPIAAQPLEATLPTVAATPVLSADASPVADDGGLATAKGPVLENVLPAPQPELPPVSASADEPAAKL